MKDETSLTTEELASRWKMEPGTLENWRVRKKGPLFLKFGRGASALVRYRLTDVIAYEKRMERGGK